MLKKALLVTAILVAGMTNTAQATTREPSVAAHANAGSATAAVPAAYRPLVAAHLVAQRTGHAVPVPSRTTQTSTTVALPSGKFEMTTSVMPVRVPLAGRWVPVSATLRPSAGGLQPSGQPVRAGAVEPAGAARWR